MVTVEAQACGCPVIAFGAGGAAETVQDGSNGIVFAEQTVDAIVHAVRRFEGMAWTAEQVRRRVETFSREIFQARIRQFIAERIESSAYARAAEVQPA
jgi:glycosyltransferase involved in cell wall biosynthesis